MAEQQFRELQAQHAEHIRAAFFQAVQLGPLGAVAFVDYSAPILIEDIASPELGPLVVVGSIHTSTDPGE